MCSCAVCLIVVRTSRINFVLRYNLHQVGYPVFQSDRFFFFFFFFHFSVSWSKMSISTEINIELPIPLMSYLFRI